MLVPREIVLFSESLDDYFSRDQALNALLYSHKKRNERKATLQYFIPLLPIIV